jgi:hypothetical protein
MYQLKGFISILSLIDNAVGAVAPFGELSLWSQTYTKDRGEYESSAVPGFKLSSIYSLDSVLGKVVLDTPLANRVLVMAKWVYDYFQTQPQPISSTDFSQDALINFAGEISYFNFGPFVSNGTIVLPEWVSYKNLNFPDNEIKLWFSDDAFSNQFEETEIITIAPIVNLDDFFLSPTQVKTLIQARTPSQSMQYIQAAKSKNPETVIRTETFNYNNPNFPNVVFATNWSVLIYGAAGDNLDSVKDAIINYILAHSTHSRAEWAITLPDLFKRTEFMLLPNWFKYAIPDKTVQAGIYSCIVDPIISTIYTKAVAREYPAAHIDSGITFIGYPYKSISINCVSGPDNKVGKENIINEFPDYINVDTSSTDFNRMELKTQKWVLLLERLLIVAETLTEFSSIPIDMRRIHRGGFLYVSATYENIQYLVGAKYNLYLLSLYVKDGYAIDNMFSPYLTL